MPVKGQDVETTLVQVAALLAGRPVQISGGRHPSVIGTCVAVHRTAEAPDHIDVELVGGSRYGLVVERFAAGCVKGRIHGRMGGYVRTVKVL